MHLRSIWKHLPVFDVNVDVAYLTQRLYVRVHLFCLSLTHQQHTFCRFFMVLLWLNLSLFADLTCFTCFCVKGNWLMMLAKTDCCWPVTWHVMQIVFHLTNDLRAHWLPLIRDITGFGWSCSSLPLLTVSPFSWCSVLHGIWTNAFRLLLK